MTEIRKPPLNLFWGVLDFWNFRFNLRKLQSAEFSSSLNPGWVGGSWGSFLPTIPRRRRFCSRENPTGPFNKNRSETTSMHVPVRLEVEGGGRAGEGPADWNVFRGVKMVLCRQAFPPRSGALGGTERAFFARGGGLGGMAAWRCGAQRSTGSPTATEAADGGDLCSEVVLCLCSYVSFFLRAVSVSR